ncbi:MAG: ECF-type sigma factor [Phycisphaerales bacterium]
MSPTFDQFEECDASGPTGGDRQRVPPSDAALLPLVYERAMDIANRTLRGDRAKRWVRASSLVHMAFLRLLEQGGLDLGDDRPQEARLLAALTAIMRRTVVDVARAALAQKRGSGMKISLHTQHLPAAKPAIDVVEIDDALAALGRICEESAKVAELRLWGGLEFEQIALATNLPLSRVRSRWNRAKAFLAKDLSGRNAAAPSEPAS